MTAGAEQDRQSAVAEALSSFAAIWCVRSIVDVALEIWRWAWSVYRIGSVAFNGHMLLVAALSLLATMPLLRAHPPRGVALALRLGATLLALRTVPLFVFVACDAAGGRAPDIVRTITFDVGAGIGRLVELVPLAGALAIARGSRIEIPRSSVALVALVVVLDPIGVYGWHSIVPMAAIAGSIVGVALDVLRWTIPFAIGAALYLHTRRVLDAHGQEDELVARAALGAWLLSVVVALTNYLSLLAFRGDSKPWWLPNHLAMGFLADAFACAFGLLLARPATVFGASRFARACGWLAAVAACATHLQFRVMWTVFWWTQKAARGDLWNLGFTIWARTMDVIALLTIGFAAVALRRMARHRERRELEWFAIAAGIALVVRLLTFWFDVPESMVWFWHASQISQLVAQALLGYVAYALRSPAGGETSETEVFTAMDGDVD